MADRAARSGAGRPVPETMRAAVLYGPEDIRIQSMPTPRPGPGEILVRLRASGICGSDLMPWYVEQKAPFVFGHEPAGDVVATGRGVERIRVGDRVALHHHAPCFACAPCRRGDYVHCPVWRRNALRPGGMAQYAVVDDNAVRHDTVVVPDSVSYEAATFVEPAACVLKALGRAGFGGGERVLVIGLGFTGQLFGLLARRSGAAKVEGTDPVPMRAALARRLWADEVHEPGAAPDGAFDLAVVTPGAAAAMRAGVAAVRPGGVVLLFAPTGPDEEVAFPVHDMFFREVNVVTSYSAAPPDMRSALAHVVAGALPVDDLITDRYSLEDAAAAYERAQRADDALKVVVTME